AYTEGGLTFFLAATTLACLDRSRISAAASFNRHTLLCGLLAGSAIACKYPGLVSVTIPLGVAVVLIAARRNGTMDMPAALRTAAAFSLGVAVTFGPWALKNLIETGNPVYPLA